MLLFCGQLSNVTFAPFGFPSQNSLTLSQAAPLVTFHGPPMLPPSAAEIVHTVAITFPSFRAGDDCEGDSAQTSCRGAWPVFGRPPAPKSGTNMLVYPGERELAVWSCVKHSSSLCKSVFYIFRAPHTV